MGCPVAAQIQTPPLQLEPDGHFKTLNVKCMQFKDQCCTYTFAIANRLLIGWANALTILACRASGTLFLSEIFRPVSIGNVPTHHIATCAAVIDVRGQVLADPTAACQ